MNRSNPSILKRSSNERSPRTFQSPGKKLRNTQEFSQSIPKFFENHTGKYFGLNYLNSYFKDTGVSLLAYIKEENYFRDHFLKVFANTNQCNKAPKKPSCICQQSTESPPKKFSSKSGVDTKLVIAAVEQMLEHIFVKCPEIFGCRENELQWKRNVSHVLRFTKNQPISTALLTRKLKMKPVVWLNQFSDIKKRTEVFNRFCSELFHTIQIVLLRHFYVAVNRLSQPVFYLKDLWHGLVHLHENRLKPKLTSVAIESPKASKIRWIPKNRTCSLRPIFLNRLATGEKMEYRALNFVLRTLLNHPDLSATRTTTKPSRDFRSKWRQFHSQWLQNGSPKMYIVQSDLKDAFGSIDQNRLHKTVKKWLSKVFSSYPHLTLYRSYNRKKKSSMYWFKEMSVTSEERGNSKQPRITKDHCTPQLVKCHTKDSLIVWVEKWLLQLFKSQVKIGKQCFEYSAGILQGHPLSSNLCELYYGDLCRPYHEDLASQDNTLVLTAMDDIILVTADKTLALRYLNFIRDSTRCPVQINLSKLSSNLCPLDDKCTARSAGPHKKKLFSFCGVNINAEDLSLTGSYCNYRGRSMFHSFTFKENQSHLSVIESKLTFYLSLKSHALFFDRQYNPLLTIARNIFELGVHLACRFHSLAIHFCMRGVVTESVKKVLSNSVTGLSVYVGERLRWRGDGTKQGRILLILLEAMIFVSHKFDTLYEIRRPQISEMLVAMKPPIEDKDLQRWVQRFKTKSLVPQFLMGGI